MVITDIEKAIVERLRKGMGRMAKNVRSYGGELDGDRTDATGPTNNQNGFARILPTW